MNYFRKTNKVFISKNKTIEDDFKNVKCAISYNSSASVKHCLTTHVINLSNMQPCFSAASNNLSDIEKLIV